MLTLTDMGAIYFFRAVFKGHYFSPFVTWDDWIDVKYLTSQWDDYVIKDKDFNFGKFGIKWELRFSLVCYTNFQNLSILIKYSLKAPGNVIYFFTKTLSLSIDVKLPPKTRHFFAYQLDLFFCISFYYFVQFLCRFLKIEFQVISLELMIFSAVKKPDESWEMGPYFEYLQ